LKILQIIIQTMEFTWEYLNSLKTFPHPNTLNVIFQWLLFQKLIQFPLFRFIFFKLNYLWFGNFLQVLFIKIFHFRFIQIYLFECDFSVLRFFSLLRFSSDSFHLCAFNLLHACSLCYTVLDARLISRNFSEVGFCMTLPKKSSFWAGSLNTV